VYSRTTEPELKSLPNTDRTNPPDPALTLEGVMLEIVCADAQHATNNPDVKRR